MPAFGQEYNGPLNDSQIDELVIMIQHVDWNEVYNTAIQQNGGYPTPPPAAQPPTAATPAGGAASPAAGGGTTFEIDMVDVAFQPTELTIPANTDVTINAINKGALPHTFTIANVEDTGEIAPGSTKEVKINLPPGEYDFHCAVPGHAEGRHGRQVDRQGRRHRCAEPAPAAGGAATPAPAGGGQAAAPSGPVEVDMQDALMFQPAEITIPANTDVTIHAVNSGVLPHTFTIKDVVDTGEVAGGASADVKVNLPPGEYEYHCAIPATLKPAWSVS